MTGASGFVGGALAERLLAGGWGVRALVRRPDAEAAQALERRGAVLVSGALEDPDSLERLVAGADTVVHAAGLVKARDRAEFLAVNLEGTRRMVEAALAAEPRPRFLLISSLAAREPEVSAYAASKRAGEELLAEAGAGLERCVLRPPGVYGPGDRVTLTLFRQLWHGFLLTPAGRRGRFSLLHVQDLAAAIERLLAGGGWDGGILELDDGREGGYGWTDLAEAAGRHLGRRVRLVSVPLGLLWLPAKLNQRLQRSLGRASVFTPGKLRELFHPDWVARASPDSPLGDWQARFTFESGFPATLEWYRARDWL